MSELVRTALLQSTKNEVFQWFTGWATFFGTIFGVIGLIVAILAVGLGVFGFNELVINRVSQKVEERINEIKADIKSRKDELDMAIKEASSAKSKLEIERGTLNAEVQTLREQREELDKEVDALRGERDNIAFILKETSFVVALHKLRYDLYQIRNLEIRSIIVLPKDNYEWIKQHNDDTNFSITLISSADPSKFRSFKPHTDKKIQFHLDSYPKHIERMFSDGSNAYIELVGRNYLFESQVDNFIGKPIDNLNGFNVILLQSTETRDSLTDKPVYKDSIDQEHWKYISSIKEIKLQLYINWIHILTISFKPPKFYLSQIIEGNTLKWSLKSLFLPAGDFFKDIRSVYEQAILGANDSVESDREGS
jgi:hypothetical protein